jgi:hypothetical protein
MPSYNRGSERFLTAHVNEQVDARLGGAPV